MSTFGIDDHKLHFHPARVAQWLSAGHDWELMARVAPLYVELSPSGACNHRCRFCALDFLGYKPALLPEKLYTERLAEMAGLGVKSVMFAGDGEPLMHKGLADISLAAKAHGLDLALTTNAVLLGEAFTAKALGAYSWIKASIGAGTPATYAALHGTSPDDFSRVLQNLERAAKHRQTHGLMVTLGAQMLLLPENTAEAATLARLCRDAGLDYLVFKPHSQHPSSINRHYERLDYAGLEHMAELAQSLSAPGFSAIYRANAFSRRNKQKPYGACLSTPAFWAYVTAGGDVYSCSAHLGDPRFCLGNLEAERFAAIWTGEARRSNWELLRSGQDIAACRENCRMDPVNAYLWNLTHPHPHVNFI